LFAVRAISVVKIQRHGLQIHSSKTCCSGVGTLERSHSNGQPCLNFHEAYAAGLPHLQVCAPVSRKRDNFLIALANWIAFWTGPSLVIFSERLADTSHYAEVSVARTDIRRMSQA